MNNSLKVRYRGFIIACVSMLFSYSYGDGDLEARLWQAAKTDNSCKPITYRGMNADLYNEYGQTPVMIAAEMNNSRFIDCLMEADVDVTIADNYGRTAFDYVKNPQSKPNEEYSVKTYSALQKLEVHQLIGDTVRITKEEFDYKKYTYTIWIEGALCQEFLIPEGIKCFEKEKINRTDTASMIFDKDVNRGVPPLFAAIQNRSYETLLDILDDGTDVNMKFKRVLPLMHAIYQNDDKLVEILLKYGANPNFTEKYGNYSPLSEVCVRNGISTVKLLLQYGADVNYQSRNGHRALGFAVQNCKNFELVKLLLDNGANPNLVDKYGADILLTLERGSHINKACIKMKKFIEGYTP